MVASWSAKCPERYRLTAVRPGGWLTSGAFEWDGVWEAVEGKGMKREGTKGKGEGKEGKQTRFREA